jgi:16S rRNA pseudouridine516 synthase
MANTQRLDKLIANFGYGSRKEVKALLKKGEIRVDGQIEKDGTRHIDPEENVVEICGEILNYREYIYLMLNKPAGVISAINDYKYETVVDLLPEEYKCFNLFPAGRLDIDTEGLILLTNDGQLTHNIISPKKSVPKKYYAIIDQEVASDDVESFLNGVILDDGYKTMPAELTILKSGIRSEIELVIYEGKFHQVKRMFEAVGKNVLFLKRIQIGGLQLDKTLKPGECRELTADEVSLLTKVSPHTS